MELIDDIQKKILYIRNCKRELEDENIKIMMEKQKESMKAMFGVEVRIEKTLIYTNGKSIYLDSNGDIEYKPE